MRKRYGVADPKIVALIIVLAAVIVGGFVVAAVNP